VPDAQLLEATIGAIVLERPEPEPDFPPELLPRQGLRQRHRLGGRPRCRLRSHIAPIRDEHAPRPKRYKARRWVGERTLPRLSKCRGLLIRYEKKAANYFGLLKLACCLIWFRRYLRLTGSR
jgi:putative transposase